FRRHRHQRRRRQRLRGLRGVPNERCPSFLGGQRAVGRNLDGVHGRDRGVGRLAAACRFPGAGHIHFSASAPASKIPNGITVVSRDSVRAVSRGSSPGSTGGGRCVLAATRPRAAARRALRSSAVTGPCSQRLSRSSSARAMAASSVSSAPRSATRRRASRQVKSANGPVTIGLWVHSALTHPSGVRTNTCGKTKNADQTISIDRATVGALRRWRVVQNREREFFGSDYYPGDYVFTFEDGRPPHPDTIRQRFDRLAAAAGLSRITFHDLRHSYATGALKAGISPKVISERIGHANVGFFLQTYAHVLRYDDRD